MKGLVSRPLEAEVDEVDALSSSALKSFEGVKLIGLVPSKLFSDVEPVVAVVVVVVGSVVVDDVVEVDKRNTFGVWLEELLAESD